MFESLTTHHPQSRTGIGLQAKHLTAHEAVFLLPNASQPEALPDRATFCGNLDINTIAATYQPHLQKCGMGPSDDSLHRPRHKLHTYALAALAQFLLHQSLVLQPTSWAQSESCDAHMNRHTNAAKTRLGFCILRSSSLHTSHTLGTHNLDRGFHETSYSS